MSLDSPEISAGISPFEETKYESDESQDFDKHIRTNQAAYAPRDSLSETTKDKVLVSEWQVPCHCIVVGTNESEYQLFHVQPNKTGSFLTFEQKEALKKLGEKGAQAIVAKGDSSWYGPPDTQELNDMNIEVKQTIQVDTFNWWRLLYSPKENEIWIDVKDKKILKKYRGF